MKRFIINIFLFFCLMTLMDFSVGYLGDFLQAHPKGGNTKRVNNLVMKENHDIVILGSSRAHHHYDTPYMSDTLGMDVYNAGFDGNGVILAYGLLEMILERYQPRLVIYDVEPSFDINVYTPDNNCVRYLGELKPYYNHAGIGGIFMDVSTEEWYKVHLGLIRYNSSLIHKVIDFITSRGADEKGYLPIYGEYSGTPSKKRNNDEVQEKLKLEYIEKLIELARSKNVPLFLVASPKLGITDSRVFDPVKSICQKYSVKFLDYYADPSFQNNSFFAEPMHLNNIGAHRFSREIVNNILN